MSASKPSAHTGGLHYDKDKLLAGYNATFSGFMKAAAIGVVGAVAYFFALAIYLGGHGHTPSAPYVSTFADRITYEYKGTKLPMFEDASKAEQFIEKKAQ